MADRKAFEEWNDKMEDLWYPLRPREDDPDYADRIHAWLDHYDSRTEARRLAWAAGYREAMEQHERDMIAQSHPPPPYVDDRPPPPYAAGLAEDMAEFVEWDRRHKRERAERERKKRRWTPEEEEMHKRVRRARGEFQARRKTKQGKAQHKLTPALRAHAAFVKRFKRPGTKAEVARWLATRRT